MANLFDYLTWRGDLTLRQAPFNAVDSLILCRLSYLPLDGIVPGEGTAVPVKEAACQFRREGRLGRLKEDLTLFAALEKSSRFSGMLLSRYVNVLDQEVQKQFSAVTVTLGGGSTYIAYRGTDSTLVGWKEDFNMSFMTTVPSQLDAVAYLEAAAAVSPGALRTGGHSKGGNLAAYAASFCKKEIQDRIVEVYNNDGPGFESQVLASPGYQAVRDRIHTFIPQSSVFGRMMEHEEAYTVVHSFQVGLMQHDMYSWEVLGSDFVRLETVTNTSRFVDYTLKEWVADMTPTQRGQLIDTLYEICSSTDAATMRELAAGLFKNAGGILKSLKSLDEDTRRLITQALVLLFRAMKSSLSALLPDAPERIREIFTVRRK